MVTMMEQFPTLTGFHGLQWNLPTLQRIALAARAAKTELCSMMLSPCLEGSAHLEHRGL